jgi:hypothetical protein
MLLDHRLGLYGRALSRLQPIRDLPLPVIRNLPEKSKIVYTYLLLGDETDARHPAGDPGNQRKDPGIVATGSQDGG